MEIISILVFFALSYGLGYTFTAFIKNSDNFLERNLMRIGIGLGGFAILVVLLNMIGVPVHWALFLGLALIYPIYDGIRNIKNFKKFDWKNNFGLTKSNMYIFIVLIIFLGLFWSMNSGAFGYDYLEDGDPWEHAAGAKYVKEFGTLFLEENTRNGTYIHYLAPYPPAYDGLMGLLHQLTDRVSWTLKFFNALMIALCVIFYYFFVREWTGKRNTALVATLGFAAIPCFLSHFIWASTLALLLFPVIFYALLMMKRDSRWMYVAIMMIAGLCVTQPSNALIFGLILFPIYLLIESAAHKRIEWRILIAGAAGAGVSMIFWGAQLLQYGIDGVKDLLSIGGQSLVNLPGSGAGMFFGLSDYVIARAANKINNPVGVGIFLSFLFMIGVIFIVVKYKKMLREENVYLLVCLAWSIVAILGIQSNQLPITFMPHRFWAILAIPLCIIAAEGFFFLLTIGARFKISAWGLGALLIVGILLTSAYPKHVLNNSQWSFGGQYKSPDDVLAHLWMKATFPIDTKVFSLCSRDEKVIGLDMYSMPWDKDVIDFRKDVMGMSANKVSKFMDLKGYEAIVIDPNCVIIHGLNATNDMLNSLAEGGFGVLHRTDTVFILRK